MFLVSQLNGHYDMLRRYDQNADDLWRKMCFHIRLFGYGNTFLVSNVRVFANGNCVCF